MHRILFIAAFGLTALQAAAAQPAQDVYQWKDANGVTHYSQTPPASGSYTTHSGTTPSPAPTAQSTPKAPAESPQCATARKNVELLQGKSVVQQDTDGDGKPDKTLNDEDRANQLELARAMLKADCPAPTAGG